MHIDVFDQTATLSDAQIDLLTKVLQFASTKEKIINHVELSLSIVTNEEIQKLNHEYRNRNEPTDVLSFQMDNPFMDSEIKVIPLQLGDIIISIDKVKEQSLRYNHSFERELVFLAVHGFLHLLGYTHDNKATERVMFEKQNNILKEFQLER